MTGDHGRVVGETGRWKDGGYFVGRGNGREKGLKSRFGICLFGDSWLSCFHQKIETPDTRCNTSQCPPPFADQDFLNFMGFFSKCIKYIGSVPPSKEFALLLRQVLDPPLLIPVLTSL